MAWGEKKDEPVKFTPTREAKKVAEDMRRAAAEKARRDGKEVKEKKGGVFEAQPRTKRGQHEKENRERINKLAKEGKINYTAGKKGLRSEWD